MPPPPPLAEPPAPRFEVGDLVSTIPETARGFHPSQSVCIYGTVVEMYFDGACWMVRLKSIHDGRTSFFPEARVRVMSRPLNDHDFIETRAPLQGKFVALREQLAASESQVSEVNAKTAAARAEFSVYEGEISRVKV
jgi:hypothetical protein